MLYPSTFIHASSQFQHTSLIQILGHIFNPRSGACCSSQSWYTCFIRFMLNLHLQLGGCYTQPCLWCRSQLARGMPLNPLVHMFSPHSCTHLSSLIPVHTSHSSSCTHLSSQFWATSLIPVLAHIFHLSSGTHVSSESSILFFVPMLDLHLQPGTCGAQPCLLDPLVHMFNPSSSTHLSCQFQ